MLSKNVLLERRKIAEGNVSGASLSECTDFIFVFLLKRIVILVKVDVVTNVDEHSIKETDTGTIRLAPRILNTRGWR